MGIVHEVDAVLEAERQGADLGRNHAEYFQNILNRMCPSVEVVQAGWGKVAVRTATVGSHLHGVMASGDTYAAMVVILAELHPAPSAELSALAAVLLASNLVRWEVPP